MYINITFDPNDRILLFGKYKGYSLNDVILTDLMYLDWCIKNIKRFKYELTSIELDDIEQRIRAAEYYKSCSNCKSNTIGNWRRDYDYDYEDDCDFYETGVYCKDDM